jgi:hypothetical protein
MIWQSRVGCFSSAVGSRWSLLVVQAEAASWLGMPPKVYIAFLGLFYKLGHKVVLGIQF